MAPSLEGMIEIAQPEHPKCPLALVLDVSGSMKDGDKISKLNEGLDQLKSELSKDEIAPKSVEIAVVTFADEVSVIQDFTSVDAFVPPQLRAGGTTALGGAILRAMELIDARKQAYKSQGVDFFRPWIFVITDGQPTDMEPNDSLWTEVVRKVHDGEQNRKFVFFAIVVEPGDAAVVRAITHPSRPAVRLQGVKFKELFEWLSKSQAILSRSKPNEQTQLPPATMFQI